MTAAAVVVAPAPRVAPGRWSVRGRRYPERVPADQPPPTDSSPETGLPVGPDGDAANAPETRDASGGPTVRYRVRRAPNIAAFLITGALLGAFAGLTLDVFGPNSRCAPGDAGCVSPFQAGSTMGYLVMLGTLIGLALAAVVFVIVERFMRRRG